MTFDWNTITTLTSVVAALTAVIALILEVRTSRTLAQIELITHLEERYASEEFIRVRSEAARLLLATEGPIGLNNALDRVLGFYEFLGLLKRQKVISGFVLWHSFSSDLFYYAAAAESYIIDRNSRHRAVYSDLLRLLEVMKKIEYREAGANSPELNLSPEDIQIFLKCEANAAP